MFGRKRLARAIAELALENQGLSHDVQFLYEGLYLIRNSNPQATVSELRDKAAWYLDRRSGRKVMNVDERTGRQEWIDNVRPPRVK